jgi:hypothetical protein
MEMGKGQRLRRFRNKEGDRIDELVGAMRLKGGWAKRGRWCSSKSLDGRTRRRFVEFIQGDVHGEFELWGDKPKPYVVKPEVRKVVFEIKRGYSIPVDWEFMLQPAPSCFVSVRRMTAVHDALEHTLWWHLFSGRTYRTFQVSGLNGEKYEYEARRGTHQDELRALATMYHCRGKRWQSKVSSHSSGASSELRRFPQEVLDYLDSNDFEEVYRVVAYEIHKVFERCYLDLGSLEALPYHLRLGAEDEKMIDVIMAEVMARAPIRRGAPSEKPCRDAVALCALLIESFKDWFRIGLLEARARFGHLEDSRDCLSETFMKMRDEMGLALCYPEDYLHPDYKGSRKKSGLKVEEGDLMILTYDETRQLRDPYHNTLPFSVSLWPAGGDPYVG